MLRFHENIENDKREFTDKMDEEKENFILKIQEEERLFLYNQDIQKSKFMSKISRKKFQFERMQQDCKAEFFAFEKQKLEQFKDKQSRERQTLLINERSPKSCDRPNRWSISSLEVAQINRNQSGFSEGSRSKPCHLSKSLNSSFKDIFAECTRYVDMLFKNKIRESYLGWVNFNSTGTKLEVEQTSCYFFFCHKTFLNYFKNKKKQKRYIKL